MEDDRYHRQKLLFGDEGQEKLEAQKVGVIGLGGIGSQIVQGLAYLGLRQFVLVDEETVEDTNLNRLVGATEEDFRNETPKVRVAERLIKSITPHAEVHIFQTTNRAKRAMDALKQCSYHFGCVDNDGARLVTSELAAAYSIPLIDSATEIFLENGKSPMFGGRVIVARSGEFCLSCADAIDMDVAKQELADPANRERREAHGYGLGEEVPAPAVVSINGVVANLALTEFLVMLTGIREPNQFLHYRGDRGVVLSRAVQQMPDCYTCKYLAGIGDEARISRYVSLRK